MCRTMKNDQRINYVTGGKIFDLDIDLDTDWGFDLRLVMEDLRFGQIW